MATDTAMAMDTTGTDQALESRLKRELSPAPITSPELDTISKRRAELGSILDRLNGSQGNDDTFLAGMAENLGRQDIRSALVPKTLEQSGSYREWDLQRRGQSPEAIRGARNQLIEQASRELAGLSGRELTARKDILTSRTEGFGRELLQQQPQLEAAIDQRLSTLLQDTGYRADIGRMQVGAALSDRGLLRGTAGSRAVGSVTAAQNAEESQQRYVAQQAKVQVGTSIDQTFDRIRQARRRVEQAASLEEIRGLDDLNFQFDAAALQRRAQSELDRMRQDSANAEISKGILTGIGGVIGAIVGAYVGGPGGAAAGAGVGGAAGAATGEAVY